MSYRDLRNLTEMMRALGFKRLISMENFKRPTFPLVTEILTFLALRFEPHADIPREIDSAQDRVIFIKFITEFMATKAHIKLNPKKLYEADGHSVKELVKVAGVLYEAVASKKSSKQLEEADETNDSSLSIMMDLTGKSEELTVARKLATELTGKGAMLYDLLGKEADLRISRIKALSKQLEIIEVESVLALSSKSIEEEIKKLMSLIENVASDEANLEVKVEKKRTELERQQKRFDALQTVRPAYMDEFEKLETDLQSMYDTYMTKYRNVAFLELIYEKYRKVEKDLNDNMDMQMKKTVLKAQAPSRKISLSDDQIDDDDDDDDDDVKEHEDDEDDEDEEEEMLMNNGGFNGRNRTKHVIPKDGFSNRPSTGRRPLKTTFATNEDEDDDDDMNLSGDSIDLDDEDDDDDDEDDEIGFNNRKDKGKLPQQTRANGKPPVMPHASSKSKAKPRVKDHSEEEDDF